ncbi:MAG TPA: hypothetical protein VK097_00670 [Lentibacillus sp.]|nr:hypothetical protein [Lentibacillus sp.]HLR60936.1 hypothetical protein [Lentibacillus sp.]
MPTWNSPKFTGNSLEFTIKSPKFTISPINTSNLGKEVRHGADIKKSINK